MSLKNRIRCIGIYVGKEQAKIRNVKYLYRVLIIHIQFYQMVIDINYCVGVLKLNEKSFEEANNLRPEVNLDE